jgi:hypothetical protein
MKFTSAFIVLIAGHVAQACELCAVYSAGSALGETGHGLSFSLAEQYIPYRTTQFDGQEVTVATPSYVDSSITHIVPGYNFSPRFGISFNLPLVYLGFRRTDLRYSLTAPPVLFTEQGHEFGLGDAAMIGRFAIFQKREMTYGILVNVLGGVKLPTGDASRIDDEVAQTRIFEAFLPPGTPHDPLGHSVSSVHQHELALGSGSYDGIFGLTLNSRWRQWFFNGQFQYYLRTRGESDFRYGDEVMVSGGPGRFLLLNESFTISLQVNVLYDSMARDELLGRPSDRTGSTGWYLGPLLTFTWGAHLSANAGIDLPLRIANNGFQNVPDYRLHGGIAWQF